jgi:hypothetical protein
MRQQACIVRPLIKTPCNPPFSIDMSARARGDEGREWWWGFFDVHLLYAQKVPESCAIHKERRPKVMCKPCRTARIIDERHRDRDAQQQVWINEVRTQEQILTSSVFSPNCPEFWLMN